jgi:hypothetical protein
MRLRTGRSWCVAVVVVSRNAVAGVHGPHCVRVRVRVRARVCVC